MRAKLCITAILLLSHCASLPPAPTGTYHPPPPRRLAARTLAPDGAPNAWAVLIGGNTELRHRGNLSIAYQTLIERGLQPEHVVVLDSGGPVPWYPWTDWTTRAALRLVFDQLAGAVEPYDTLWVYVTGHGTQPDSTLKLNPSEVLTQAEFTALVNSVRPAQGVVMYDQCYGGKLAALDCRYTVVATAATDQPTHATTFARAWWGALRAGHTVAAAFGVARKAAPRDQPSLRLRGAVCRTHRKTQNQYRVPYRP